MRRINYKTIPEVFELTKLLRHLGCDTFQLTEHNLIGGYGYFLMVSMHGLKQDFKLDTYMLGKTSYSSSIARSIMMKFKDYEILKAINEYRLKDQG